MIQNNEKRHNLIYLKSLPNYKCLCKCDLCGSTTRIQRRKFGITKSCGCLKHRVNKDNHTFKGIGQLYGKHWGSILRNARIRKIELQITKEEIWELFLKQDKKCALTGLDIEMGRDRWTASLDRIDSSRGYVIDNVQWVHKQINRMKQDLDETTFIKFCRLVISNKDKI